MGSKPHGIYTASGVSAILGMNQFKTPVEAWQELMEKLEPGWNKSKGYKLPEKTENAALMWGLAFEPSIIMLSEEKHGSDIIDREKLFIKEFDDISISCHVDGIYKNDGVGFEGKSTNSRAYYSNRTEIMESLNDSGELEKDFVIKKSWGEEGTEEVPESYQIQCAIQRLCADLDSIELNVLVFPKTQQEFDDEGWNIGAKLFKTKDKSIVEWSEPVTWARVFAQIGNFKTYQLPRNEELENTIIKTVKTFHQDHVLTGLPPAAEKYDDIKRLLCRPQGTIICTDPRLKEMCEEYSEITRQLGASGPMSVRKEALKIAITQNMKDNRRDDWANPPDKIVILDPNGGAELASFSKSGFRTKRAH